MCKFKTQCLRVQSSKMWLGLILSFLIFIQCVFCLTTITVYAQSLEELSEEQQIATINQMLLDISHELGMNHQCVLPAYVSMEEYLAHQEEFERLRQLPHLTVTYYHDRSWPEIAATYMNNITINLDNLLSAEDAAREGVSVEYYAVQTLAHEMRHVYQFEHMYDDTDYGRACLASAQGDYVPYWNSVDEYRQQFVEQDAENFGYQYADAHVGRLIYTMPEDMSEADQFITNTPVTPIEIYDLENTLTSGEELTPEDIQSEIDAIENEEQQIPPIVIAPEFEFELPEENQSNAIESAEPQEINSSNNAGIDPQSTQTNTAAIDDANTNDTTEILQSIPAEPLPPIIFETEYVYDDMQALSDKPDSNTFIIQDIPGASNQDTLGLIDHLPTTTFKYITKSLQQVHIIYFIIMICSVMALIMCIIILRHLGTITPSHTQHKYHVNRKAINARAKALYSAPTPEIMRYMFTTHNNSKPCLK